MKFFNPKFSGKFFAVAWIFDYLTTIHGLSLGLYETNPFWARAIAWAWLPALLGIALYFTPYRRWLIPLYIGALAFGIAHIHAGIHNLELISHA